MLCNWQSWFCVKKQAKTGCRIWSQPSEGLQELYASADKMWLQLLIQTCFRDFQKTNGRLLALVRWRTNWSRTTTYLPFFFDVYHFAILWSWKKFIYSQTPSCSPRLKIHAKDRYIVAKRSQKVNYCGCSIYH